ncbi:MAG TPA: hypothetical protein VGC20_08185 [bacterium]
MANRAFAHPHLLGGLPNRRPLGQQPLHARALGAVKPMRAVRPALALHHPEHARALDLALLAVQRAAIDLQGGTELVLARQAQLHHLHRGQALPHRIVLRVHKHRHPRSEIGHLVAFAHQREHRVDRFGPSGLGRQVQLRGHR